MKIINIQNNYRWFIKKFSENIHNESFHELSRY